MSLITLRESFLKVLKAMELVNSDLDFNSGASSWPMFIPFDHTVLNPLSFLWN